MPIPVENFTTCDGSMTSEDGMIFYFHVRRDDGSALMLGFPHRDLPNIVECAAMQMDKGKNSDGGKMVSAFFASGFGLGRGQKGETVLSLSIKKGGKISFLLDGDLVAELWRSLGKAMLRN